MPKDGFKTITVSQQTFNELDDYARKTHRSVPQVVALLAERAKKPEKGG